MNTETTYIYRFEDPKGPYYKTREPIEIGFNSHKAAEEYIEASWGEGATFSHAIVKILK
jgi:hypothetical protein